MKLALILLLAVPAFAQTPQFSTADKIAIQALEKTKLDAGAAYQDAQQKELAIFGEFTKLHPGFHVDPQTFAVAADPKPEKKPEKPEPKPADKPADPAKK